MFKIISKKRYNQMLQQIEQLKAIDAQPQEKLSVAQLCNYAVIKSDNYPCASCNIENQHCLKLQLANRTICIAPAEYVNSFKSSKRVRRNGNNNQKPQAGQL